MPPWYRGLEALLRALREEHGWSLRRAVHEARRRGIPLDRHLLRRAETGQAVPGRPVLRRLALLYAVPGDALEEEAFLAEALVPPPPLPPGADPVAAAREDLARGRPLAALARLEEALHGAPGRDRQGELLLVRAAAARALGLPRLAARTLEQLAREPGAPGGRLTARRRLAEDALAAGLPRRAAALLGRLPAPARHGTVPAALHRALLGEARAAEGRRAVAVRHLAAARRELRRAGDRAALSEATARHARAVARREPTVAEALAREALAGARRAADRRAIARRLLDLAAVLAAGGEGDGARAALREAAALARAARLPGEEFLALDGLLAGAGEPLPDREALARRRDALLLRIPWLPPRALARREEILAAARRRATGATRAATGHSACPWRNASCAS